MKLETRTSKVITLEPYSTASRNEPMRSNSPMPFPRSPDVLQHHLVWKLLQPEKSGMTLTESGQIIPEQSTAAIVVHHPKAKYFVL